MNTPQSKRSSAARPSTQSTQSTQGTGAPRASAPSRRQLLSAAGAVAAGAGTAGAAPLVRAAPALSYPNSAELRVGLVGCGGRGTGAALNALRADENCRLVALGDAFADMLEQSLAALTENESVAAQVDVSEDMRFTGFDAFEHVIANCDVVLLATPPHFRPQHLAAAVAAGKHVFCEKPVAVDPQGVRSVLASARSAKDQGLSLVSGLCYRYQFAKLETLKRLRDGAVGEVVAIETTYNTGGLWHRGRGEDWSDMEWQLRNWLYFTWLSGDHIVEQHVHSLDKMSWVMNDRPPRQVTASGGRQVRTGEDYGNVYDHFNSVFEWEDGVRGYSSCRQWPGASSNVSDHVLGTRGRAELQSHRIDAGPWSWRWRSEQVDDMYQNEHDALFAAIRSGEPLNNGEYMSTSTLLAIMARMSAYTGRTVTWDEAMSSELDLSPPAYEWGALEVRPPAQPG